MQLTDTTESNSQFYENDESSLSIFWSQQWQTFPLKVSLCSCGDGVGSFYQQQQPKNPERTFQMLLSFIQ